jgi:hypothetical protein
MRCPSPVAAWVWSAASTPVHTSTEVSVSTMGTVTRTGGPSGSPLSASSPA